MGYWPVFCLVLLLAACGQGGETPSTHGDRPMRIVSLDYCADQYVLKLADRNQILALSPDAISDFSYMREGANGLPKVRPRAEDVLVLKPDLIVRSYGGGAKATALFEEAGVRVLQLGWVDQISGEEPGSVSHQIRTMAAGLGQPDRGRRVSDDYLNRLEQLRSAPTKKTVLYVTAGGVTTGEGSLVHQAIEWAGLSNFEQKQGWHPLPLERLAYEVPHFVAISFFGEKGVSLNTWSAAGHSVVRNQLRDVETVSVPGAWTSCGAWFITDAIEAFASAGQAGL